MGAVSPYAWKEEQNWKHITDYSFYMKVKAVIFFYSPVAGDENWVHL